MAGGGGGGWMPPPKGFPIFLRNGKTFLQTKFLPVGSSLGHLSMKKFFRSDLPVLALKLDKWRMLGEGGGNHPNPPSHCAKVDIFF